MWASLTKSNVGPEMLLTAPDTTTPPEETITEKSHLFIEQRNTAHNSLATSLLVRRKHRPDFPTRISLPKSDLDDEVLPSPPPTQAMLSPLPEANKRYAGHTPLIPRALSPEPGQGEEEEQKASEVEQVEENQATTPDLDEGLSGPLMLPTDPVDGADDHIALDVLDHVLEKVAKDQDRFSRLKDAPEPTAAPVQTLAEDADESLALSRKGSADSRQSASTEVVDGVRLKSPPLNFGAPYGQLSFVPPSQA
jgi:hypothetical protein